jgi:uncharacterized protein
MARRIGTILLLALAACRTSAPSRFYTLDPTATADGGAAAANYAVAVGPVSIPPIVDRPQFVVQVAPNRITVDEFNRWASPLDDNIARTVAGDLAVLLGTPRVVTGPLAPSLAPMYRVAIDVQRFESVPGQNVVVDAVWAVQKGTTRGARSGRTVAREPVAGAGFDALAAAHSRALAKVSADIAAAIRAEAAAKP